MKNVTLNQKDKQADEPIVISDECGDSRWDAVLEQEIKTGQIFQTAPGQDTFIDRSENIQAGTPVVKEI